MVTQPVTRPRILEYDNYRAFLRDYYAYAKAAGRGFSFRTFARAAGFSSPNFLQLVIKAERNLSPSGAKKFARALKLNAEEGKVFDLLVQLNQAKSPEVRVRCAEKLLRCRSYQKFRPLKGEEFNYYARWYCIPVRELVGLPGFQESPEWVARQILPPITREEARSALATLERLGLIRRNERGQFVQTDAVITTGDEVSAASVREYHREMIKKASESIERVPHQERELSAAAVGLSAENVERVKSLLRQARRKVLELAEQEQAPERVYQVNFQMFPLTVRREESK